MAREIVIGLPKIVVTLNHVVARERPNSCAATLQACCDVFITRAGRYKCRALKLTVTKLIDHHSLVCVTHGVDVAEPLDPWRNVNWGNHKPCGDNKYNNEHCCRGHCLFKWFGHTWHGSEYRRHDKRTQKCKQKEYKKGARFATQIGQKIQNNIKTKCWKNFARQVNNKGRNGFGWRVVKCITTLLFDNWALHVQRQNFNRSGQGIK